MDDQIPEREFAPDAVYNRKRKKADRMLDGCDIIDAEREEELRRIVILLTRPSYALGLGSKTLSAESRDRLHKILRQLIRQHNWVEASGVLSVLLKGTSKERAPIKNQLKYSVSMELLKRIEGDRINPKRIRDLYDVWMRKIGSMKTWPIEERFSVHLEFILFCLTEGNIEDAHQAALCLKHDHEIGNDPMSNMIVGLTFRQLWYSTIPEEMQWRDSDQFHSPVQSKEMEDTSEAVTSIHEADSAYQCTSKTSIRNDKLIASPTNEQNRQQREYSLEANDNQQREHPSQNFVEQDFDMCSSENTGNGGFFHNRGGDMHCASVFPALVGLDPLLLPIRLPHASENWEDVINFHGELLNEYYREAVKHLQLSLYSTTSPKLVALLPFIQLLLVGGQIDEALNVLEKFCYDSKLIIPIRLRAMLLEHFRRKDSDVLSRSFELVLKTDPTCSNTLAKLLAMHQNGEYSLEALLEMIALHLEATFPEHSTWKKFASCFLKLSQHEEDRMSGCLNGSSEGYDCKYSVCFDKKPKFLMDRQSERSWRLRCKWWQTRHFTSKMLASEIAKGDLQLLTYKAASASHMYGPKFSYVEKVYNFLGTRNDCGDLYLFLKIHLRDSTPLFPNP